MAINNDLPKEGNCYACLSAVPDPTIDKMIVSVFEIAAEDWDAFLKREFEYRLVQIPYVEMDTDVSGLGVVCMGDYASDQECEEVVQLNPIRLKRWQEFRAQYEGAMWRNDLEPCPEYLERCINILKYKKPEFLDNFLDTTFVGDNRSIREYLVISS